MAVPITTSGGKNIKRSPISSMREGFRSLKGNLKGMSKTILGIQDGLQKENEIKKKRLETLKENRLKQKDLQQKQAEEERLEKPNLVSSSLSNIGNTIKKTGGNIFGDVLKIIGLLAGAWLVENIDGIMATVKKAIGIVTDVWERIGNFVTGTIDIVKGLAKTVLAFGKNIIEFDFADKSGRLKEAFSEVELGWNKLNSAITGAERTFDDPENNEQVNNALEGKDVDTDVDKDITKEVVDDDKKISTNNSSSSLKVDPLVVLEDNKDLVPLGTYDLIKSEVQKNPSEYDTQEEINAALQKFGIDPSEVKYRKTYSGVNNKDNIEEKQKSVVGKVNQQVNNAGKKLNNEQLRIEGIEKMNQRVKDLTPSDYEYGEVIKVVLPPSRNDYDRTPSGSRSFKRDMKTYVIRQNELNRLESKRALEHIDG